MIYVFFFVCECDILWFKVDCCIPLQAKSSSKFLSVPLWLKWSTTTTVTDKEGKELYSMYLSLRPQLCQFVCIRVCFFFFTTLACGIQAQG